MAVLMRFPGASFTLRTALSSFGNPSATASRRWLATAPSSDPNVKPAASPTGKTVTLDHEAYHPNGDAQGKKSDKMPVKSLVVCHGLFGSKQNWRSLGKAMSARFGIPVYALDLRNHGTSPHIEGLAYGDMAQDVIEFMSAHELSDVALIGHSMGGKVAMSVALDPSLPRSMLKYLVSVDMSAKRGPLSPEFENYVKAMIAIREAGCKTRSEADQLLQETEKDMGVRQFLLTNLTRDPPDSPTWSWRIPVDIIQSNISQIGDFPYNAPGQDAFDAPGSEHRESRSWNGQTLFIKGTKSKYVNRRNIPTNQAYFPNSKLVTMDTGHWCQAEKPKEFMEIIETFLQGNTVDETQDALQPRSK